MTEYLGLIPIAIVALSAAAAMLAEAFRQPGERMWIAGLGLIGLVGAGVAPLAGRRADRQHPRETIGVALLGNIAAWIVLLALGHTLWGIAVGVLLLDAATQAAQVSNQARVYALPVEAHSRYNTIYMVCYFVGGSLGSAGAVLAWDAARWNGVCAVALTCLTLAYGVYFVRRNRPDM
jgi:predicted MFS family arabinose efflux permease